MKSVFPKGPMRCCVVTRDLFAKEDLLRVVRTPQREVLWDPTGKMAGRGAYICPTESCIDKAKKMRSLDKSLRISVPASIYDLLYEKSNQ